LPVCPCGFGFSPGASLSGGAGLKSLTACGFELSGLEQ
jgi:hypothetical protein